MRIALIFKLFRSPSVDSKNRVPDYHGEREHPTNARSCFALFAPVLRRCHSESAALESRGDPNGDTLWARL